METTITEQAVERRKGGWKESGFDAVYRRMYRAAKRGAERTPANRENGIRAIIFGSFYVEAVINRIVGRIVFAKVDGRRLAGMLWETAEKANIVNKLFIAMSVAPEMKAGRFVGDLRKIFELRNRLVHYKEALAAGADGEGEEVGLVSDPEIEQALDPESIRHHLGRLDDLVAALEVLLDHAPERRAQGRGSVAVAEETGKGGNV